MNVLLISANTVTSPYPVYPLGLDYVAAALLPHHRVRIADMNSMDLNALAELMDEFRPHVVGISLRNIDNTDVTLPQGYVEGYGELVRIVRLHTGAPIVLGGAGYSIFPERLLSALGADYGIVGEGEQMAALVASIESRQSTDCLPGIIKANQHLCPPVPLKTIPPPLLDSEQKHLSFYLRNGGMLNLQTKRGCPFRCIYCTYPRIEGNRFRFMDPATVGRTAKAIQEAGAKYFFITDSAFNADIDHSLAVAAQFRKNGVTLPWGAFLAPIKMPAHYFDSLVEAGLSHVEFGTESLSDRVLKTYDKPFERSNVLWAHGAAVEAGLHVAHYFLFGGPGETPDTLETTLSHIDKLKKSVLFLFCGMRIYPHTVLFEHAVKKGQINRSQDLMAPVYYQSADIGRERIIERLKAKANNRINWVIGSGGDETGELLRRMYGKGYSGPLWEFLIR